MNKKWVLGAVAGAFVILGFTIIMLVSLSSFLAEVISAPVVTILSLIALFLAPIAGGFLAGMIGKSEPRRAGLFAGLSASLVILAAWLVISGVTYQTFVSGLIIGFMWVFLARMAAGFVKKR